ncbi:AAA family ATPase [Mucilaginibacter sp. L3T2-6]|uniref:AAA family ATPase n=1 Tax=Mucilaginibacter sp. L3T2-6 TaxID=3062491 RepID=UPI00267441AA|nr:AAA family ATPase [Mucilaginibacter sp. L3T2-6]MDO3641497.1 AAA family ATPase [Mucilaginibacter sp. L3T2-6]MDV6213742.1 AAA family ATPase [Mucilaginibacter sp. L3T2-6]
MTAADDTSFPQTPEEQLIRFLNYTNLPVFLTGKAGTGKTTLLKNLPGQIRKNYLITASTGIAGVNAGGVTLHSLFQIPGGVYIPGAYEGTAKDIYSIPATIAQRRYEKAKLDLLHQLELLIIDEISMVRADLLDVIDQLLRKARNQPELPFGGVQVLMIGDLYQLPPVLTNEDEPFYSPWYATPYFFSAKVMQEQRPVYIELQHIYRQDSDIFKNILNNIRAGTLNQQDVALLNERLNDRQKADTDEFLLTLTSHVALAEEMNKQQLDALNTPIVRYDAMIKGQVSSKDMPVEHSLKLKVGARVIFVKNDLRPERLYYNGKTGVITKLEADTVWVQCAGEQQIALNRETWPTINPIVTGSGISSQTVGEFAQFPLKLAWAITIHKSQGLTLDGATIDAGEAFTPGQVYVAFSRLKSLDGLTLTTRIRPEKIFPHSALAPFEKGFSNQDLISLFKQGRWEFILQLISEGFNWFDLSTAFERHRQMLQHSPVTNKYEQIAIADGWLNKIKQKADQANKFRKELKILAGQSTWDFAHLLNRVQLAVNYFNQHILDDIIAEIAGITNTHLQDKSQKTFIKSLGGLSAVLTQQQTHLRVLTELATDLQASIPIDQCIERYYSHTHTPNSPVAELPSAKKASGATLTKSLEATLAYFKQGLSLEQIAERKKTTNTAVEKQYAELVAVGKILLSEIFAPELCEALLSLGSEVKDVSQLRIITKGRYSFFELRMYINFLAYLNSL